MKTKHLQGTFSGKSVTTRQAITNGMGELDYLSTMSIGMPAATIRQKSWKAVVGVSVFGLASLLVVGSSFFPNTVPIANASSIQDQISDLSTQNASNAQALGSLQTQAQSYEASIQSLQLQINGLQAQIDANVAQQNDLQAQIDANQIELTKQKLVLGEDIKMTYVDGQPSTIEMIASSKNLSDFVDKEEYRNSVQTKIQETLKKIADLQNKLNAQKTSVDQLISDQQGQQSKLDAARSQQNRLLAYNQDQQTNYTATIKANQSKINALVQQLNALGSVKTLASGGACDSKDGDTYPTSLCSAAQDSIVDQWGMYNRECVSYAAWMEASQGRNVPYGMGNAGDWPASARAHGITVDTTPEVGSIAIRPAFSDVYFGNEQDVGHAMYVEALDGNGQITVSEYNANLDGTFKREIKDIAGTYHGHQYQFQFIHFR